MAITESTIRKQLIKLYQYMLDRLKREDKSILVEDIQSAAERIALSIDLLTAAIKENK